jgi:hypothetical protein
MLDPFRKKSSVLSRFFGRGRPVPGSRFQTGKPAAAAASPRAVSPEDGLVSYAEGHARFLETLSIANPSRDFLCFAVEQGKMSPAYVDTASRKMLV